MKSPNSEPKGRPKRILMLRHNCAYFALPGTTSILYLPYTYPYLILLHEV